MERPVLRGGSSGTEKPSDILPGFLSPSYVIPPSGTSPMASSIGREKESMSRVWKYPLSSSELKK